MHTLIQQLMAQTPVQVMVMAATVAIVVQLLKLFLPRDMRGRVAIAANVAVSAAAVWEGMHPAAFWSETTLAWVLVVAAAAAGVSGTARDVAAGSAARAAERKQAVKAQAGIPAPIPTVSNNKLNTGPTDPQLAQPGAQPGEPPGLKQ